MELSKLSFGYVPRACYACDPAQSRGRALFEPESPTRTAFQRDRDRIIHSNAFRRLKHKTQVFISEEGDHYRTRLTHSIEVSQIARSLARAFRLDEDLAEALALAHDLGHPPFGHAGEKVLDDLMRDYGGFDHNFQALRIVAKMERRYPRFDGLNLSWEILEGLAKHNGPVCGQMAGHIRALLPDMDLRLTSHASLEAQAAAIADDIAYNAHDIDDGLRAGLLALEDLKQVSLPGAILQEIANEAGPLDEERTHYELSRRLITRMVENVISQAQARLAALRPGSADDIRHAGAAVMVFSDKFSKQEKSLKAYLYKALYYHPQLMRRRKKVEKIVQELFVDYFEKIEEIPDSWRNQFMLNFNFNNEAKRARLVSDYIAGMSDGFARKEHKRLAMARQRQGAPD